jgi:hypothetical protein
MRVKVSKSFFADEFLYPGETDINKIDLRLIEIAQWLRDTLAKPVTINNYATGGQYKESGLRSLTTTTGAKRSAHKEGKAIDIKVKGMTAKEVYEFCLKHSDTLYAMGVREIEDQRFTPSWLHLSTRGNWERIKIIKP